MSKITGKRIGQLIISSDVVPTASDVEQYVNSISADLQQAIEQTVASGYVPTSRKINGIPLSGDINVGTITGITMNGASRGTAGDVNLGDVLTAVPSAYNTYDETKQSLSGDGYATQEQLNKKSAVSVDNAKSDVNMVHISQADYEQLVVGGEVLSNVLYVVSADYAETYGQQIKNVAPGTDLSDAVNVEQLLSAVDNVQVPTDLSSFNNSPGYLVSTDISNYCKKSETSSASQISAADELLSSELSAKSSISVDTDFAPKFKFEHISLEDYISKSISGIVDGNTLYDISSENMTVFGQKIVDLAPGEDPTDAVNVEQLLSAVGNVQVPTDLSAFSNSPGYLVSSDISGVISCLDAEIGERAPLDSPEFVGTPTVPDPTDGSPTAQVANIRYVDSIANAKLNSASAAPLFSPDLSVQYAVGSHVTYNGKLYKCTTATTGGTWVAGSWTADTMTDQDAVLDITAQNQLRVVAKDGTVLWAQGYDLASTSSATLACDATNNFTFANGSTTQAFTLPTAPTGKVGDFGLDIDNSANTGAATMTLTGLDTTFSVVVPEGESLNDMLAIAAGELARFYITLSTFRVNNLPTWHIVKQVVENGGAQS